MVALETERLILRNYKVTDFNDVFEYFSNEEVAQYEDFYPMTRQEVREIIDDWKDKDYRLVVERKDTNKVIGSIGYWRDENGNYSIDYDFNPSFSKCGYATEAGKALIKHLFCNEKIEKLYGDCDVRNVNSWKLMERLGFLRIKETANDSYKNDMDGNPILITTYTYLIENRQCNYL